MNWAKIDFKRLVQLLLPTFLRKPQQTAFLNATIAPLETLYSETMYKMQHNGQVIYLEKVLNEFCDVAGYNSQNHEGTKQIIIEDAAVPRMQYVYREDGIANYGKPYLRVGVVYITGDYDHNDFVVKIPTTVSYIDSQIRAIIDYYKLAGKKYTIENI